MPRKSKERRNRGRGRGNNGQDREQLGPGRSKNGAAAAVSDFEEKRNRRREKRRSTRRNYWPKPKKIIYLSKPATGAFYRSEVGRECDTFSTIARGEARPECNFSQTTDSSFCKTSWEYTEKCEQMRNSSVASPASKGYVPVKSKLQHPPLPGYHRGILVFGKFLLKFPPPLPGPKSCSNVSS